MRYKMYSMEISRANTRALNAPRREMKPMKPALRRLTAILLICLLTQSACTGGAQVATEDARVALPEPEPFEERQILGDARAAYSLDVTLCYAAGSGLDLTSVTRTIEVEIEQTAAEATLQELLKTLSGTGALRSVFSSDPLIDLELSCGIATVNLTLDAGARQSDQDVLLLCVSIANTLLELDGIDAVNILTGGRSEAVCALPLGTFVEPVSDVSALYAQLQAEESRFLSEQTSGISRSVALYFPSSDGSYLLPEVRTLSFSSDDYASAALDALKAGPQQRACCFSAIPGNQELLSGTPQSWISEAGERVIDVYFSEMLPNYLAFAGVETWQFYGSIVLTLCSFLPELDAVRICIEGEPVTECALGSGMLHFEKGLMRRSDFSARIGSSAELYFPVDGGGLKRVECAMSRAASRSPRQLLCELIRLGTTGALAGAFPEDIASEDILGVEVTGDIAVVNLSGSFYSHCQTLDPRGERSLIYAMINSLTDLEDIHAVRFLVEGKSIDSLVGSIYLRTALLPDPGLVIFESESAGTNTGETALVN